MSEKEYKFRNLQPDEIEKLKSQGCSSENWMDIIIHSDLNLDNIHNVRFRGSVTIYPGVILRNIPGGISNITLRENVRIDNVASLEFKPESQNGLGTKVAVLDETGSRSVQIYPGLSSQVATLMARDPLWAKKIGETGLQEFILSRQTPMEIGDNSILRNCGSIKDVYIGKEVVVEGAIRLENGSVINNALPGKCFTYIGHGVEAENFILEDARLSSQSSVKNCYIGQGVEISHGFSTQDSMFFANSTMENGEAHALLAGPYTVSMHKGTLLIGCQTSFMNAGSLTNQSNHMYKLGPVHWGIMERGVKTSSGSYLMLGAKIGAFSLLMGSHKTHPDSSEFPFSYLFGDERGGTVVVPAVMLRSCGLMRDELKWPSRDRRLGRGLPLFDHISFNVLNPFTVDTMLKAIGIIESLLNRPADDDLYMRYKGMKFTRAALERAKNLYTLAIYKYLSVKLPEEGFKEPEGKEVFEWVDLGGQILPRPYLDKVRESDSIEAAEAVFTEADARYEELQQEWISIKFKPSWNLDRDVIKEKAKRFDELIDEDRQDYLDMLDKEQDMLTL